MADKQVIEITISPDGEVKGDVTTGPGGAGCVKALLALLSELAPGSGQVVKKREFYATHTASQKAKANQ